MSYGVPEIIGVRLRDRARAQGRIKGDGGRQIANIQVLCSVPIVQHVSHFSIHINKKRKQARDCWPNISKIGAIASEIPQMLLSLISHSMDIDVS